MSRRSNSQHRFSEVPTINIPRSTFDRSHAKKLTMDADYLVPIYFDDIIPGDTFNVQCNFVTRLMSPTLTPLMDNMYFDTFFFFVPYRLVWDNWEKFMGAQDDPGDSIDYTIPVIDQVTIPQGSCADYFGLPTLQVNGISALPFRAYRLIWNEWFRAQDLQDSLEVDTFDSNSDGTYATNLLIRNKRHDYFTSCLPWPQKGTAVSLPLGTTAPIFFDTAFGSLPASPTIQDNTGGSHRLAHNIDASYVQAEAGSTGTASLMLMADLSSASAATINDLRLAFQTQRLLERDARSGTRYVETVKAHFGVTIPDFRVQRPEYLGGGSSRISVSPVAQTTYQGTGTVYDAKGSLAGIGYGSGTHGFAKSFVEHGVIIGLANVRGDITYSQGVDRYWNKSTRYDFYYPVLSQLGEQAVLNKEIYWSNSSGTDDAVFGYQEMYAEYRYKQSTLGDVLRSEATGHLATHHLAELFSTLPALNSAFIASNTRAPLDRAIAVPSQPQFIVDCWFDMKCARPMPLYGVPGNLDHF